MEEQNEKTKSRKFIVWIVWLVITIAIIIFCGVVMVFTKQILESMTGLIEKVLTYFFAISMMYLGVNVGQKIGFAFANSLPKAETEPEGEEK